jgi:hypothetical protein
MPLTIYNFLFLCSPSLFFLLVHNRYRGFLFSLDHTQTHTTVGRTPLDERSVRRRILYLTTKTLYERQTSMPPVWFEPTIPASEPAQTYALDRATTAIGYKTVNIGKQNYHANNGTCNNAEE